MEVNLVHTTHCVWYIAYKLTATIIEALQTFEVMCNTCDMYITGTHIIPIRKK
jgi:hypothetical protein